MSTSTRAVRVAAAVAALVGVSVMLLTAPAEASTSLPPCNAENRLCLAIHNKSDQASYKLNSFSLNDKVCVNYKPGWGPGDTVGWPNAPIDFSLSPDLKQLKAFSDAQCRNEVANVPKSIRPQGGNQNGYTVIGVGPHFVRFSMKKAVVASWCVTALDSSEKEIEGASDCDRLGAGGTSTFWVPEKADKVRYDWQIFNGPSGSDYLSNQQDWCFRMTAGGTVHEAKDKPCTLD